MTILSAISRRAPELQGFEKVERAADRQARDAVDRLAVDADVARFAAQAAAAQARTAARPRYLASSSRTVFESVSR